MGQKVSPVGLRVGINRDWDAAWYADKANVANLLLEDIKIREYLENVYKKAALSRIVIERLKGSKNDKVKVTVYTGKPGTVIGREAETKNAVVKELSFITKREIIMNVVAIQRALKAGAKGAKTLISGRLGGAEMARSEGYNEGQVPLTTLRADIDYAVAEAHTTYGKLGVKVWIYKGEILEMKVRPVDRPQRRPRPEGKPEGKFNKAGKKENNQSSKGGK